MSEEKAKIKNIKRLPASIQYSVILWIFISSVATSALVTIPGAIGIEIPKNWIIFSITMIPWISGFIIGWWLKFRYAKKQDDEALTLRIKAQFWGAMAFMVAFVISILLIMMTLIIMENNQFLPDSLAEPITFTISLLILAISLWVANNTKNRIYRNFVKN